MRRGNRVRDYIDTTYRRVVLSPAPYRKVAHHEVSTGDGSGLPSDGIARALSFRFRSLPLPSVNSAMAIVSDRPGGIQWVRKITL